MRIDDSEKPHGLRDVISSVLAAGLGVQSNKNRERDFAQGSAKQFIIVGLLATLAFIAAVYFVVKFVLRLAGV